MKPLLSKVAPARRTLLFAPVALFAAFLAFFIVGLIAGVFIVAALLALPLGLGVAWLFLGTPDLRRKDGRPWIEPKVRPYMSIPTAALVALVLYYVVGIVVTPIEAIPIAVVSYITIAVALAGGVAAGVLLFGAPPVARAPRDAYAKIPPEKRPYLFFPLAFLFFAIVYYGLGTALTSYGPPSLPQALVAIPVALVSGAALAYLLVGFPRPKRKLAETPPIPARARPVLFAATVVALGPLFAFALGPFASDLPFGGVVDLYIGLGVGYVLAIVAAFLAWGGPRRWGREGDWRPNLPPELRVAFFVPAALLVGSVVVVVASVAGLPFAVALLLGTGVGVLAGLAASGALKRVRRTPEALRELPEIVKPLVFFAVWFLVGGLVYVGLVTLFGPYAWAAVVLAFLAGLAAAAGVVEGPYLRERARVRAERRRELRVLREERANRLKAVAAPPQRAAEPKKRRLFGKK